MTILDKIDKIDRFVIERVFEPPLHRFQRRTGRTGYVIAWWLIGFFLVLTMLNVSRLVRDAMGESGAINWTDDLVGSMLNFPCVLMIFIETMRQIQKHHDKPAWSTAASAWKRSPIWIMLRVGMLAMSMNLVFKFAIGTHSAVQFLTEDLAFLCMTAAEYIIASRPLPPGSERKIEGTEGVGRMVLHRDAA